MQQQDVSAGVILAGNSLVLQKVERGRSGNYSCEVANSVNKVTSEPVTLRIKCKEIRNKDKNRRFV